MSFLSTYPVSGPWLGGGHCSDPRGGTGAQEAGPGPVGTNAPLDSPKLSPLAAPSTHLVNSWDDGEGLLSFTHLEEAEYSSQKPRSQEWQWEISFLCIFATLRGASHLS